MVCYPFLVRPLVLVQPAKQVDIGTGLQFHFPDPVAEGAKGFHRQVDPTVVVFLFGVVDYLPDAEPDGVPLFGKLESRGVVIPLGNDGSCDNGFDHDGLLSAGLACTKIVSTLRRGPEKQKSAKERMAP